ncbi:ATP-binding protein [Streptomyces sp. NBC_01619]|uniref:sensor histidine kinase n=1 Tax=Streptomyces sp. NBC_01619 TaxID=2975901 RepID=UPI002250428C|nr:ATP-binding protein [Streptomyces sp. NBC_01619]MCX4514336.1 ATP-binding protein [Streptomyces sp. NBC_01619]
MSTLLVPRSIRAKIVCLLMVPAVSLMALWAFATVTTARSVSELNQYEQANSTLLEPVDSLVAAVQSERSAALRRIAAPSRERADFLTDRERATDAAVAALGRGIRASSLDAGAVGADFTGRADRLVAGLEGLRGLRTKLRGDDAGWREAYDAYNGTVAQAFALKATLAGMRGPDTPSAARVVLELARAREMIAREDALMGAAQVAGRMTRAQFQEFIGTAHTQRQLLAASVDDLRPADAAAYRKVLAGPGLRDLRAIEDGIRDAGEAEAAGPVATAARWSTPARNVLQDLAQAQRNATTVAADAADPLSFAVLGGSGVAVVLGLAGVVLSLVISVRIGRGLVVELVGLRNSALRLAGRELPETIARLHAGKPVDIDAVAPMRAHRDDEVGQVGAALVAVHRAAVTAAAERAEVLHGISGVYVNLARRSQALLHRQLALLDTMERRNEDPVELEDLFRLDHLTTRMRRHAESLIILSGAVPGRAWRRPVPLMDVVRAAVAEVEDYDRVQILDLPTVLLPGAAVADLTHLLAELIENATAFSPPHTKVGVSAERVGSGIALEIEDRGLGLDRAALAEANRRIEDTERVDLLDSGQLGLFVVNRIAHRLDVRVALRRSVFGGVVAVVLLPGRLAGEQIEEAVPGEPEPAVETTSGLPRRAAARPRAVLPPEDAPAARATGPAAQAPAAAPDHGAAAPAPAAAAPVHAAPAAPAPLRAAQDPARTGTTQETSAPGALPATAPAPEPPHPGDHTRAADRAPVGEDHLASAGRAELPRRVRQAGPMPEHADEEVPYDLHDPHGPRDPHRPYAASDRSAPVRERRAGRTPEQARAAMASFRSGWSRGQAAGTAPQQGESKNDTAGEGESR